MKKKIEKTVKTSKETFVPSLTSNHQESIEEKILNAINNKELQRGIDKWIKTNDSKNKEITRDLNLLSSIINEYLDSFILFGYNLEGERVLIQSYQKPKDKDAMMEFLKIVFIRNIGNPDNYPENE
jgi:hypothetical protein